MKKIIALPMALLLITVFSCKQVKKEAKETTDEIVEVPITLTKLEGSPTYADAGLVLTSQKSMTVNDTTKVDFDFEVTNYELGAQTESENATKLANSGKGQHIHFILNNQPYSAHYEASFTKEIPDGWY